jgi:hypothetical protein
MIDCVSRIESNNSTSFKQTFLNDLLEHHLSIIIELTSFLADGLVIKYFRVCSVRVLATDLPALEEGVPIYKP